VHKLIMLLALAAVAVASGAVPASASTPEPVAIAMNGHFTRPNTVAGTWSASGAFTDSGTYTETFRIEGQSIHGEKVLVGTKGTLVLNAQGVVVFLTPTTVTFKAGSWEIVDGTGAYERLHAGGTPAGTPDSFADLATDVIHITHAGDAHDD